MDAQIRRRRLSFSGAKNFRDLGGYETADGRTTRWDVLYRSDHLHKLTRSDFNRLTALGIDRVIDFRSELELQLEPDRLPAEMNARVAKISILDSTTQTFLKPRDQININSMRDVDPVWHMTRTYTELATRFTPQMQIFIRELLSANGRPVLFHCTAGKDRTGFAAALILRMLGVPQEIVMKDYLLSNQCFLPAQRLNLGFLRLVKGKQIAAVIKGFLEARPAYLGAAFEVIDKNYGSFERYICDGLGLEQKDLEHLKVLYLE